MLEPRTMNYFEILERIRDVVRQNMETKLKDSDEIEWDKHHETLLFYAMLGLKPVGVNRHFMMTVIHDRFSSYISKELSSKFIWEYLESLYDMAALHESEIIPFPNDEVDFELPEEVDDMVKEKFGVVIPRSPKDENEAPKNNSNVKSVKKLGASKLKQNTTTTASAKNAFQTPVSIKPSKNSLGSRSESRPPSAERVVKGKQDAQLPGRVNKVRASSPFTPKSTKSETVSSAQESVATPNSTGKKSSKTENHNSLSAKKTPKSEPVPSANNLKKSAKSESNSSSSKQTKTETPDNSNKKVRAEKEQTNKKGKVSLSAENSASKKSSKSDVKKTEAESNNKKSSDTPSKPKAEKEKGSSKGSKYDDAESPAPSGSRKSGAGKVNTAEKKKKWQKVEESSKKGPPPAKRRRTLNS